MQVSTAGDRTEHVTDWSVSARTDHCQTFHRGRQMLVSSPSRNPIECFSSRLPQVDPGRKHSWSPTTQEMRTIAGALFNPWARTVRRANSARAQVDTVSLICWDTENLLEMVTPNIFIDSERMIPGFRAGGVIVRLLLGLEKIIFTVLELFRVRLFHVAHSVMLEISSILVSSIDDVSMTVRKRRESGNVREDAAWW